MKVACRSLIILLFLFLVNETFAQRDPVSVTIQLTPPYSVYLADYVSPETDPLKVNLILLDLEQAVYDVRLHLKIEGPGVHIETNPSFNPQAITLQAGTPVQLSGLDLDEYFRTDNLLFGGLTRNQFTQRGGALPEGFYRFTFIVRDVRRPDIVLSREASAMAWLTLGEPPMLNLPHCGSEIKVADGQQAVLFQWTSMNTSAPNSALSTEYEFTLVQIQQEGFNPNDAINSLTPIYQTTTSYTSLLFGPSEPQLIPGMEYVWRVRAKDTQGRDLYKNDGYSKICTFRMAEEKILLGAPENVIAVGEAARRGRVSWDFVEGADGYKTEYRKVQKDPAGTQYEWFGINDNDGEVIINDLEPETQYEARVGTKRRQFVSTWSDPVPFKTPVQQEFACGQEAIPEDLLNDTPLFTAMAGDIIKVGNFEMRLNNATGGDGVFSGRGSVYIPFMMTNINVRFENIVINENQELISGTVFSITNGLQGFMENWDDGGDNDVNTDEGNGSSNDDSGNSSDNFTGDDVTYDGDIDSVYTTDDGVIVIVDADGNSTEEEIGDGGTRITDANGDSWNVDEDGNVTKGDQGSGSTDAPAPVSSPDSVNFIVEFKPNANQKYGFDAKAFDIGEYEQATVKEKNYWIAWKSVETGRQDVINAKTDLEQFPESVGFKTISGEVSSQVAAEPNEKQVYVTGKVADQVESVTAYVKVKETGDDDETEIEVGKLNIKTYDQERRRLIIVPVNDASAPAGTVLSNEINSIYQQAVAYWDITIDTRFEIEQSKITSLDNEESGILASFPQKMREFNREFKRSRNIDKNAYYIFLVKGSESSRKGFMPFKRQYGYIFTDNLGSTSLATAIAHELAHGAFRLRHPQSEYGVVMDDNLMHNTNGKILRKFQWDNIHNPRATVSWFEEDDETALDSDPILAYILKKAEQLNLSNEEVLAILHCKACSENNNLGEIKPIKGIDVELGEANGKAFLFDAPKFKCLSILYDESASTLDVGTISGSDVRIAGDGSSLKVKLVDESVLVCNDYLLDLDQYLNCSTTGQNEITTTYIDKLYKQVSLCLNGDQRDLSVYPVSFDFTYQQNEGFESVIKQINNKLDVDFFKDVKMAVKISNNYGQEKTLLTSGLSGASSAELTLDIHIDEASGRAYLSIKASEEFLSQYVAARQQNANARGIQVDVEELRAQVIADLESLETHSMFSTFCQSFKSIFSESIGAFVEVVQTTQKASKTIWKDGQMDQGHWWSKAENRNKWPGYATMHPLIGGSTDALIDEVTGIPVAIRSMYGIMTDEEQRAAFKQLFTKEGMNALVDGIGSEITATINDTEKLEHAGSKGVVTVAAAFFTAGITKSGKGLSLLEDLLGNMGKLKEFEKLTAFLTDAKKVMRYDNEAFQVLKKQFDEVFDKLKALNDTELLEKLDLVVSRVGVDNFSKFLPKLHNIYDIPGFKYVIRDLANYWTKFKGAKFVVDYIDGKGDDFIKKIKSFEAPFTTELGLRKYDIELLDGTKLEFKDWTDWKSWSGSTIRNQFIKDLSNPEFDELGKLKWIFNKTNIDESNLKDNILKALKKADESPVDELERLLDNELMLERFRSLFKDKNLLDGHDLLKHLENKTVFEQIFEVTD